MWLTLLTIVQDSIDLQVTVKYANVPANAFTVCVYLPIHTYIHMHVVCACECMHMCM